MRNNPNEFAWTDAAIERLKALWAEGLSASECGKRMGVSRNSVIGKVHRLGLSGKYRRPREGRARRMTKPKASKPAAQNLLETKQSASKPPEMPQMRQNLRQMPEEPRRGSFDLLDLKLGQCRWPEGDGPYLFCGAPQKFGSAYCEEHWLRSVSNGAWRSAA